MAFEISPEVLAASSVACNSTAQQIAEELAALKSYVLSLREEWHGVAAQEFDQVMQNYDAFANLLHMALTGIGRGLQGTYSSYTDAEQSVLSNLTAVGGEIPGSYY